MTMKTVEVILRITYNPRFLKHPRRWDWNKLVCVDKYEQIEVLPTPQHDDEKEVETGEIEI